MNPALMCNIVYVGNKKWKQDNVAKTGAAWFGFGDVQVVERKSVPEFLKYPDVFMLKTEFDKKFPGFVYGETEFNPGANAGTLLTAPPAEKSDETAPNSIPKASLEEIKGAIVGLDHDNPEHYSPAGKPLVKAVRDTLGKFVDVKDLNAAWAEIGE